MTYRKIFVAAAAVLAIGAAVAVPTVLATSAHAQTSAQKAMIDAAKAQGTVGEQADGFLGFRTASSDGALTAAVSTTNAARRAAYAASASDAGTSADVAGTRMFETLIHPRIPSGQWYRTAAGAWVQK